MKDFGECPRCGSIGTVIENRFCWNCVNDHDREQAENMLQTFRELMCEKENDRYANEIQFAVVALEHLLGYRPCMSYPGEADYPTILNGGDRTQ